MNYNLKTILVISFFQLAVGIAFSQKSPTPPKTEIQYHLFDQPAEYPGGMAALKEFIANNLIYPETAKEKGIQGRCYLQFIVSESGQVNNIKIKKGVVDCKECDLEAIRVVNAMPKWIPAQKDGKNVNSTFYLPVSFKP